MVLQGSGKGLLAQKEPVKFESDKPVGNCKSLRVLKSNPDPKKGMGLLTRLASLTAPIMRKYDWQLPELQEFFPDDPSLLGMNVNRGQRILIRLRPTHAPDTFYDLESHLMGTMLHELTHNRHGGHDKAFYEFLDKLQEEYDNLRMGGYSGEGFSSSGKKLSTEKHDTHLPLNVARQKAVEEAEKRRKRGILMGPPGGRKLGGEASRRPNKTPRELMLEAAERRMRDDKSCQGAAAEENAEVIRADREAIVVDLSSDEEDTSTASTSRPIVVIDVDDDSDAETNVDAKPTRKPTSTLSAKPSSNSRANPKPSRSQQAWTCTTCTFAENELHRSACAVCETPRPGVGSGPGRTASRWECHECGSWTVHERWSCEFCLAIKRAS